MGIKKRGLQMNSLSSIAILTVNGVGAEFVEAAIMMKLKALINSF